MKKSLFTRVGTLLLAMVLLVGLVPASRAVEDTVTVTLEVDIRALAEHEMLEDLAAPSPLPVPVSVTVPAGSTLKDVLLSVAAKTEEYPNFTLHWSGDESYLNGIDWVTTIDAIQTRLFGEMDTTPASFSNPGWLYAINGDYAVGAGVAQDTVTDGATYTFRYSLFNVWDASAGVMHAYDAELLDAFDGLKAVIVEATKLDATSFTEGERARLATAIAAAEDEVGTIEDKVFGLWFSYFAQMDTFPSQTIAALKAAKSELSGAMSKVPVPTAISGIPDYNAISIPVGGTYQLAPLVLPEGAPQDVTYEVFSDDKNCFTVTSQGLITGLKAGTLCMVMVRAATSPATVSRNFIFSVVEKPETSAQRMEKLMAGIAGNMKSSATQWWDAMAMSAYARYAPDKAPSITDQAKQDMVNSVIKAISQPDVSANSLANSVNHLRALGYDIADLTTVNKTKIDGAKLLRELDVANAAKGWYLTVAPYVLAACAQGEFRTERTANDTVSFLLGEQDKSGIWSSNYGVDSPAMVLQGLSRYYGSNVAVKTGVDALLPKLSELQKATGSYGSANSDAMVIVALAQLGIDPATDTRFIKGGKSLVDGLLGYALKDNSGFWFGADQTKLNPSATAQGLLALAAAAAVAKSGAPFDALDCSENPAVPAVATKGTDVAPTPPPATGDDITAYLTVKSHTGTWLAKTAVTLKKNATVYHAFTAVLDEKGYHYEGAAEGYVTAISKPDGTTLTEFDQGPQSGWLYKVNSTLPDIGITDYKLSNGDHIVWYYTTDWTKDPDASQNAGTAAPADKRESVKHADGSVTTTTTNTQTGVVTATTTYKNGVELKVTTKKTGEQEIEATLPKGVEQAVVHVPTTAIGLGAVAILVETDGTRRVLPLSAIGERGMAVLLTGTATLVIGDNVKSFTDIGGTHWGVNGIAFVAARGLFVGAGDGSFDPAAPMTAGMLDTVLARLHGTPAPAAPDWTTPLTRKTLAQALCDAAGETTDDPMAWVEATGLMQGKGDGNLAADQIATRAEVAVTLERLVRLLLNK